LEKRSSRLILIAVSWLSDHNVSILLKNFQDVTSLIWLRNSRNKLHKIWKTRWETDHLIHILLYMGYHKNWNITTKIYREDLQLQDLIFLTSSNIVSMIVPHSYLWILQQLFLIRFWHWLHCYNYLFHIQYIILMPTVLNFICNGNIPPVDTSWTTTQHHMTLILSIKAHTRKQLRL
jgi:hypothetical protein